MPLEVVPLQNNRSMVIGGPMTSVKWFGQRDYLEGYGFHNRKDSQESKQEVWSWMITEYKASSHSVSGQELEYQSRHIHIYWGSLQKV